MTPAARIEAAIDLLARIDALEAPADGLARGFFRTRRYIGSKDRRAISGLVYGVTRRRARLDWWIEKAGMVVEGARGRVIADLTLVEGRQLADLTALFDGGGYHPPALTAEEQALVERLQGQALDDPAQPEWVRGELPDWLLPRFQEAFDDALESELAALSREASLDLRVNRLKADRPAAAAALVGEGLEAAPTPLSPLGLRLEKRYTLPTLKAFQNGLIEVQDEGSQLVALLCDARPGQAVADICAGAGGKTLALAAAMEDFGRLVALDRDSRRLERTRPRLARAGVENAELRGLDGPEDPWLTENAAAFDRVLVDAPCTGSGAWRRHPDARWQLSEATLGRYLVAQQESLELAAQLVAPGGRLIYATCSLLPEENGRQVVRFRAAHPDFVPLPVPEVWASVLGGDCPTSENELLLTPARHGCDGFFVAVLQREGGP